MPAFSKRIYNSVLKEGRFFFTLTLYRSGAFEYMRIFNTLGKLRCYLYNDDVQTSRWKVNRKLAKTCQILLNSIVGNMLKMINFNGYSNSHFSSHLS